LMFPLITRALGKLVEDLTSIRELFHTVISPPEAPADD